MDFCNEREANPFETNVKSTIEFLTALFDKGYSYTAINAAKSAIQALSISETRSSHDDNLLKRFMKGVFNCRPNLPKYKSTWDVNKIFDLFVAWGPSEKLGLMKLTLKTSVLLLLLSGRRGNSIINISLDDITMEDERVRIHISKLTKTSGPGKHVPDIIINRFSNPLLCMMGSLKEYINCTSRLRNSRQLFVSYVWPHGPVTRDTLSRWTKRVMSEAGIDLKQFQPHSMRSAVVSKAASKEVSLATIIATIGWRQAATVAKFYHRPIEQADGSEVSQALLSHHGQ